MPTSAFSLRKRLNLQNMASLERTVFFSFFLLSSFFKRLITLFIPFLICVQLKDLLTGVLLYRIRNALPSFLTRSNSISSSAGEKKVKTRAKSEKYSIAIFGRSFFHLYCSRGGKVVTSVGRCAPFILKSGRI